MQRHLHHTFKVFPQHHLPMTWIFKIWDNRLFVTKFKKVFALTPCMLRFPPPSPQNKSTEALEKFPKEELFKSLGSYI